MRRYLLLATMLAGAALAAPAIGFLPDAKAAAISSGSEMNISGNATFTTGGTGSGAEIVFSNPANAGTESGDFLNFGGCTNCITMAPSSGDWVYNPFSAGTLFSGVNGANTVSFDATSQVNDPVVNTAGASSTLSLFYDGVANLTGFDPTTAELIITLNELTKTGSFSLTVGTVPEPSSMATLGVGLLGLGFLRRFVRRA